MTLDSRWTSPPSSSLATSGGMPCGAAARTLASRVARSAGASRPSKPKPPMPCAASERIVAVADESRQTNVSCAASWLADQVAGSRASYDVVVWVLTGLAPTGEAPVVRQASTASTVPMAASAVARRRCGTGAPLIVVARASHPARGLTCRTRDRPLWLTRADPRVDRHPSGPRRTPEMADTDVIDLLTKDHREVERIFAKLESDSTPDDEKARL